MFLLRKHWEMIIFNFNGKFIRRGAPMSVVGQTLKAKVLETIQQHPLRPTELVSELRKEAYAQEVEGALSELLDEGSVVFGSDRHLRVAGTAA
jgi:hypothetical protein